MTEWWDVGKNHIKSLSINYSTDKQKTQKFQIQNIINDLSYEKQKKQQNLTKIQNLQQQLNNSYASQNEGATLR